MIFGQLLFSTIILNKYNNFLFSFAVFLHLVTFSFPLHFEKIIDILFSPKNTS